MAGQIKKMIDRIIEARAKRDPVLINTTRTKLILKGIRPDDWTDTSPDDPAMMARVQQLAQELEVKL